MTELTRRQMRELERSREVNSRDAQPAPAELEPAAAEPGISIPAVTTAEPNNSVSDAPLTRRQLRQMESSSTYDQTATQTLERASALTKSLAKEVSPIEPEPQVVRQPAPERKLGRPLPPVGATRRERRVSVAETSNVETTLQPIEVEDVEIPQTGALGASFLGEPSTQSIVLETAPEAISLPADTGEIFTTGSIAILPETNGSTTGSLDGIELDQEEAVTGVISTVDPVSAKGFIDERSSIGVVPSGVLRKGWWKPWAVGALSLVMAVAALLASLTIFNAIGG